MEELRTNGYFLGLVDGILVSKELCQRMKGSARTVKDYEFGMLKETDLLLSNLAKRRAETILEFIGDC